MVLVWMTTCRSQFSPPTVWVLGLKLKSSSLAVHTSTCWTIFLAHAGYAWLKTKQNKKNVLTTDVLNILVGPLSNSFGVLLCELCYIPFLDCGISLLQQGIAPVLPEFPFFVLQAQNSINEVSRANKETLLVSHLPATTILIDKRPTSWKLWQNRDKDTHYSIVPGNQCPEDYT